MPNLFTSGSSERTLSPRDAGGPTDAPGLRDVRSRSGNASVSGDLLSDRSKEFRPRGLLSETRLAAQVLDELSTWLLDPSSKEGTGLLLGTVTEGLANIEELRPLSLQNGADSGSAIGVRLAKALDKFKLLREPNSLQLMGWCCVRPRGDMRELGAELAFHNQRFRRSTDLLLVFRTIRSQIVSAQLYARSCDLPLSAAHHRAAPITLPDEILSINSVPRASLGPTDGDLYLNSYGAVKDLGEIDGKAKEVMTLPVPSVRKRRPSKALAEFQRGLVRAWLSRWGASMCRDR